MKIKALAHSTTITVALITIMTVVSELSKPFKELLANLGGHHWVGKGLVSAIVFILGYFILASILKKSEEDKAIMMTVWVSVISVAVIFLFYILHYTTDLF